jgi:hypothetical protein
VLDLHTGERSFVTRLPPGKADDTFFGTFLLTCCPTFVDDHTILFQTYTDPDDSNPGGRAAAYTVRIDGSDLKRVPAPLELPGSAVVPSFGVSGPRRHLVRLSLPGTPESAPVAPGCPYPGGPCAPFPIAEVFVHDGSTLVQLTKTRRADTFPGFMNRSGTRAFFLAADDPLGTNLHHTCQLFSINPRRFRLRQLTHFEGGETPVP